MPTHWHMSSQIIPIIIMQLSFSDLLKLFNNLKWDPIIHSPHHSLKVKWHSGKQQHSLEKYVLKLSTCETLLKKQVILILTQFFF